MTGLGWTLIAAAGVMTVYGFAWALCNAARIGDDALMNLEDDQVTVDAEFAAITAGFGEQP